MEFLRNFRYQYSRTLRASGFALLFTIGFCLLAIGILQPKVSGQNLFIAGVSNAVSQSDPTRLSIRPTTATVIVSNHTGSSGTIPRCTPITFGIPSAISLESAPIGLSVQNDQPTNYQIFGNTADQLRTQLKQCGPRSTSSSDAEFAGQNDYNLNWQYDQTASNNQCTLTNVKVGIHTGIALPHWQPTNGAPIGLASRWQNFANGLHAHETGHVAIDKAYASKLLADLGALGTLPCDQIIAKVQSVSTADTANLSQANDTYDATTDHGANQGAVLPTY